MPEYLLDNAHKSTEDRFTALECQYDPVTIRRLTVLGVPEGGRCLEIGAGRGSIAHWLANRVGPTGSVLATDIDVSRVRPSVDNLEIREHDIATEDLAEDEFDIVHARLVLCHIPERREILSRIRRALRPGGYLLLDEFDNTWMPVLRAPDRACAELFAKILGAVHHLLERGGVDGTWGRKAYGALDAAGYVGLGVHGFCEEWRGGSVGASMYAANARQLEDKIVACGLASRGEVEAFDDLMNEPTFTAMSYLLLSTWGRRSLE